MKNNSQVLFFCGPHCAGKTTILKSLLEKEVLQFCGYEIGKDLFYKKEITPTMQDADLELKITEYELSRDFEYANKSGLIGIETWHPGNLAYAMVRNPDIVPTLVNKMKGSPLINRAFGIRFQISPQNIKSRTITFKDNSEWAAEFYSKIDSEIDFCIEQLGLKDRVYNVDANRPFLEVLKEVDNICKNINTQIAIATCNSLQKSND